MNRKPLNWFFESGCIIGGDDHTAFGVGALITALYIVTQGNPCNECHCKLTCPAWKLIKAEEEARRSANRPRTGEPCGPTNSELAARLGVSKRQISKMRTKGTLDAALSNLAN